MIKNRSNNYFHIFFPLLIVDYVDKAIRFFFKFNAKF